MLGNSFLKFGFWEMNVNRKLELVEKYIKNLPNDEDEKNETERKKSAQGHGEGAVPTKKSKSKKSKI